MKPIVCLVVERCCMMLGDEVLVFRFYFGWRGLSLMVLLLTSSFFIVAFYRA